MLNKVYGIDYNTYICGGIGECKLARCKSETILFYSEVEMLKTLVKLKDNKCIGEIELFTSVIGKVKYEV